MMGGALISRKIIIGAVFAIATVLAALVVSRHPLVGGPHTAAPAQRVRATAQTDTPSHITSGGPRAVVDVGRASPTAVDPSKPFKAATAVSDGIRLEFSDSQNLAEFIRQALQRPHEGGRLYAYLAFNKCMTVSSISENDASDGLRRAALAGIKTDAFVRLRNRCQGVISQYPDLPSLYKSIVATRGERDPLLPDNLRFEAKDQASAVMAIEHALRLRDPNLVAMTLEANAEYLVMSIQPNLKQDGKKTVIYLAAASVACEVAGTCRDPEEIIVPCVLAAICDVGDRREYIRRQVPSSDITLFDSLRVGLAGLVRR